MAMPRVAPIVFRTDRSLRVLLFFVTLGWLFFLFAYDVLPQNVLTYGMPVLGIFTLHALLKRNRTLYDPEANVLVRYTGYIPFLKRRELGQSDIVEMGLEGDTKDIVSRAELVAVIEPNGERVSLDRRIGTSSDAMLLTVEGISDRMNVPLRVDDEFDKVVAKTGFSRGVRRIFQPIAIVVWSLVCVAAGFVVFYLSLVREGFPVRDAEVYVDLYSRAQNETLTRGFKIEAVCLLLLWTGLLMAYRGYLAISRKPIQFDETEDEVAAQTLGETVAT
jgi:hypothetical protein